MLHTIKIGNKTIGENSPVFIVAEISGNHNQSYDRAVKIVEEACKAGVDAIKLQTYTPDTITIDSDKEWFRVNDVNDPRLWQGKTLYELYEKAHTPWEWQPKLKKIAEDHGLVLFSTPFDSSAVDFLANMDVPCYKVASYEVNDVLLLKKIAQQGKPVIMSVGFASLDDIELALTTLRDNGASEIAILHCVTAYSDNPKLEESNLATILDIRDRFGVVSGFSDNNSGIEIPTTAAIMGASIIEKHFTLDRSEEGPDSRFSIEPGEMKEMVAAIRSAEKIAGKVRYGPLSKVEEANKRRFRRSLFVVRDIKSGEKFTRDNIRSIRPAYGLHTKFFEDIIGKVAAKDIERGTPLSWEVIE